MAKKPLKRTRWRFKDVWMNDLFEMKGKTFRKLEEAEYVEVYYPKGKTDPREIGAHLKIRNNGIFVSGFYQSPT